LAKQAEGHAALGSITAGLGGKCIDFTGQEHWQIYFGTTISAMALSRDKRALAVASYSGMFAVYDLDAQAMAPHQVGLIKTSEQGVPCEIQRWVLWPEIMPIYWE